jgi:hypothetical protein
VRSRHGIFIVPDRVAESWPADRLLPAIGDRPAAVALDEALNAIARRYGQRTSDLVAMLLEYPRDEPSRTQVSTHAPEWVVSPKRGGRLGRIFD